MSAPRRYGLHKEQIILAGLFFLWSLAFKVDTVRGAEPYSIEAAQLHATDLPQPIAGVLNKQGQRIFTYANGIKISICEIFWASTVSAQDQPKGRSIYGDLTPGTLLGVIRFLPEAGEEYREDSHDQKLKPGYYTMRYTVLPGGDAGDFAVLSPPAADRDSKAIPAIDRLMSQGRLSSHTDHPAVLRLVPAEEGDREAPSVRMDEGGTCILQVRLHAKSDSGHLHEVSLALILVNPLPEGDGS